MVYSPDHALAGTFGAESYVPKNARKGKNEACTEYKVSWAIIPCLCAISYTIIVDLQCEIWTTFVRIYSILIYLHILALGAKVNLISKQCCALY